MQKIVKCSIPPGGRSKSISHCSFEWYLWNILILLSTAILVIPGFAHAQPPQQRNTITYEIPLSKGLNCISLPCIPVNPDVSEVFSGIEKSCNIVMVFDKENEHITWKLYNPELPQSSNTLYSVNEKMGILIDMKESRLLTLEGYAAGRTELELHPGWNLVGYPSLVDESPTLAFGGLLPDIQNIMKMSNGVWVEFSPVASGSLETQQQMQSGTGYWILVDEQVTWKVEDPLFNVGPARNIILQMGEEGDWDEAIREKMWFHRKSDNDWELYYCGYDPKAQPMRCKIGYATSADGIRWEKYEGNPIRSRPDRDYQDPSCVIVDGVYYLYLEEEHMKPEYRIELHTSTDGIHFTPYENNPLFQTPTASPVVWTEPSQDGGTDWYMIHEEVTLNDDGVVINRAISLAASSDGLHWEMYEQNPVIGGEAWVIPDAVYKDQHDIYHIYYHHKTPDGDFPTYTATSTDLIHWDLFPGNPIHHESSTVIVPLQNKFWYYIWYHRDDKMYHLHHK